MRTMLAAGIVFYAAAAAGQELPADAGQPITARNWRKHPKIVEVRQLYEANEEALAGKRLKRTAKSVCEPPALETARAIYRDDAGRIRKYVVKGGSDDSAYVLQHHYDDQGRLRFVFARSGAVNESTVEHRLYYAVDGALLWRDRRATGVGYSWAPDWPEWYIARDALKAFRSKSALCARGRSLD